ncbi:uncharacterized protein LOC142175707 [Nicotiana tabacum]|uniref:Uncharacterized protein LOC142175707 n=1 Tax=Nicotiana tabacum TaxID=4097 RepID=A0AC58TNK5_TOBAC
MSDNTANTLAPNTTGGIPTIDSNHAYLFHFSDAPGMSLVNTAFDGKGFQGWRRSVLIALFAKNKIGFINGACPAPALTSRDYQPWSRCNDMVTSWLLNSLSKDIGDSVIYSKSAKDLCTNLEHRFGQSNGAKLYHLRKELSSCLCVCEGKQKLEKSLNDERLIQFLMDSLSFMVTNQNNFEQRSARQMQRNPIQHQKFGNNIQKVTNSTQRNTTFKGKKTKFNPNETCSHCKKVGHTVSDCYRIIGFPEDFEFTKGNQVRTRSNGLVQLIKQVKGADSGNSGTDINANDVAGTIARYSGTCLSRPLVKRAQGFVSFSFSSSSVSDVNLWHIRLGHLPFLSMKHLSFISLPSNSDCFCQICPKARQTRIPFPLSQIKLTRAFELIHVDVWGPYKESTYNGFKYFLTVVDDYSREIWTFLMSTNSNTFGLLKNFLTMVERQFGVKVQKIRTDNAFELGKGSQEAAFLAFQGVLHQTSCVATPQQNGVVERKHRHLLEIARALLFQSKLPLPYWGECVLTATYFINRLPSRVLKGKTPYFFLFKQKPSYELLKCFGYLCFVST